MKHRPNIPNHHLTEREIELVAKANLDPSLKPHGTFRVDENTFQCDFCDSRLPHNAQLGARHLTDMYITEAQGIACRLCRAAHPEWHWEEDAMNQVLDMEATKLMGRIMPQDSAAEQSAKDHTGSDFVIYGTEEGPA